MLKHYCETTGCVYIVIYCTADIAFSESMSFAYKDSQDLAAKNEFCMCCMSVQGLLNIQYSITAKKSCILNEICTWMNEQNSNVAESVL